MNRKMTQDQWDTIIAVKHHDFDEFWKQRCANAGYLTPTQKYGVISNLALETFNKTDWFQFQECVNRAMSHKFTRRGIIFKKRKQITMQQLLDCYISAITCMQMVYPD